MAKGVQWKIRGLTILIVSIEVGMKNDAFNFTIKITSKHPISLPMLPVSKEKSYKVTKKNSIMLNKMISKHFNWSYD